MKKFISLVIALALIILPTANLYALESPNQNSINAALSEIEDIFPSIDLYEIHEQYQEPDLSSKVDIYPVEEYSLVTQNTDYYLTIYNDNSIGFTTIEKPINNRQINSIQRVSYLYIAAAIHILEMDVVYNIVSSNLTISYIIPGGTNVVLKGSDHGTKTASVWGNAYYVHNGGVVQEYVGLKLDVTFYNDGTYTKTETPGLLY